MNSTAWRLVGAVVLGIIAATAFFGPLGVYTLLPFIPVILFLAWAIWIGVALSTIREEIRGLRSEVARMSREEV